MAIQRKISRARNRGLVGVEVPVLVSGLSEDTDLLWEGRMPTQAPEIDGLALINDIEGPPPRPGEIRRLKITEARDYDVIGTLLPPSESAPRFAPDGLINLAAPVAV
jgi:ribosomal protein S12 methylthiotransferase